MDPWLQIHGQQVDPLPEDSVDSDWWIRLRFGVVEFFFSSIFEFLSQIENSSP